MNEAVRKRTRRTFDRVKSVQSFPGAKKVMPVDDVSSILERYTGKPIPLAQLYPAPPPPVPEEAALRRAPSGPARAPMTIDAPGRSAQVNTDEAYRRQFQLKTIHKFLLRGASMAQISSVLGLPVAEVHRLKAELYQRIAAEAGGIDLLTYVGRTIAFYDEIKAMSLRGADGVRDWEVTRAPDGSVVEGTNPNKSASMEKARYLMLALAAENNQQRFLERAGFFDHTKLTPKVQSDDEGANAMQVLRQMFNELMDPALTEERMANIVNGDEYLPGGEDEDPIRVLS